MLNVLNRAQSNYKVGCSQDVYNVKEYCNNTLPRGGVYWTMYWRGAHSSRLEAVYCHSIFQSRSVLEITLQTAGVYGQNINSVHSRSIKDNDYYNPKVWYFSIYSPGMVFFFFIHSLRTCASREPHIPIKPKQKYPTPTSITKKRCQM